MTSKAERQHDQEAAIATLREHLRPGDTVYTILRHVSASRMTRAIAPIVLRDRDGECEPWDATYFVARALDSKTDQRHGGVKMGGAGMDMGFALVYNLSAQLFNGDGYALNHRWL